MTTERTVNRNRNNGAQANLVKAVKELGHLASPHYLKELGYTEQEIEKAVRDGQLEWRGDGNLNIKED